jgi:uncharacterized repeat protein (TIGR01451 family)
MRSRINIIHRRDSFRLLTAAIVGAIALAGPAGAAHAAAASGTRLQPRYAHATAHATAPAMATQGAPEGGPANDTCAGAATVSLNSPVTGTITGATNNYRLSGSSCFTGPSNLASEAFGRDVVYLFTAPSAGTYSFRVTNWNPETNLVVYVASACPAAVPDTPVVVTGCLGAANRAVASTAETVSCVTLSQNQQVAIFVDENFALSFPSTFTLEVTACSPESEPNDTPATADPLACGVEGSINPAGDVDFYALGAPAAGSRVFAAVDTTGANLDDFDLRVTTANDTLEYDEGDNDTLLGSNAPNISGLPLTGAQSYLRVNYLSPSTAAGPYRLYSVVQPPIASATPEVEPNNTIATGTTGANNYFTGSLALPEPSTDVDIYCFTATAGDLLFLGLDMDPERNNTPIDGALALLDASGNVLASVNNEPRGTITDPSPGTLTGTTPSGPGEALVFRATTTGTYYARVSIGSQQMNSLGAGNYLLSIAKNCQTGGGTAQSADLSLTKSANPSPAVTQQPITYTVTVTNPGPSTATNLTISDPLPAGTTFTECTVSGGTGGSCSGPPTGTNGTVTANWSSLLPGQSVQLVITASVTAGAGATLTNTATVTSNTPDPNTTNNSSTIMTPVTGPQANLSILKSDSPDPVAAGSNITYSIFVDNEGPSTATSLTVSDTLPANVTFVSLTEAAGWTCTEPPVGQTGTITCTATSLASAANATITVVVNVNSNVATGAMISNTATVTSATADPDTSDNSSTAQTEVIAGGAVGDDTVGIYDANGATWFLRNANSPGSADVTFIYGTGGAQIPIRGDWDGDGDDTAGLYDPTSSTFFLKNTNGVGGADITFIFGSPGQGFTPIVGDWNGDGVDTIGLYQQSTATFFLKNTNSPGVADVAFIYGAANANWRPLAGDWDGDGDDTVGLYDPTSSTFFLKNSNGPGSADLTFIYGAPNSTPLAGDFDADGDDTIGVYSPANGTFFLRNSNSSGAANVTVVYGAPNRTPLVGDWDGV